MYETLTAVKQVHARDLSLGEFIFDKFEAQLGRFFLPFLPCLAVMPSLIVCDRHAASIVGIID